MRLFRTCRVNKFGGDRGREARTLARRGAMTAPSMVRLVQPKLPRSRSQMLPAVVTGDSRLPTAGALSHWPTDDCITAGN